MVVFALEPASFMGCEIFGLTEGITSSVRGCCFALELPFIRSGLIDLCSTFTLLVAREALENAVLCRPRRRANLDCESCSLFSA